MTKYLKSLQQQSKSHELVSKANRKAIEKASRSLEKGVLEISLVLLV
jgi:hypothetical protein